MKHLNRITNLRNLIKPLLFLCCVSGSLLFADCNNYKKGECIYKNVVTLIKTDTMLTIWDERDNSQFSYKKPLTDKQVDTIMMHLNKYFNKERVAIDIKGGINAR